MFSGKRSCCKCGDGDLGSNRKNPGITVRKISFQQLIVELASEGAFFYVLHEKGRDRWSSKMIPYLSSDVLATIVGSASAIGKLLNIEILLIRGCRNEIQSSD